MLPVTDFAYALTPLYLMALIGFIARKTNTFNIHANQVITQLMLYITLPALILFSLNTDFSYDLLFEFFWLMLMSVYILTIFILTAFFLRKRSKISKNRGNVFESLIIFGNQGFIGFAISFILLGQKGILYLTLFNIIYLILI